MERERSTAERAANSVTAAPTIDTVVTELRLLPTEDRLLGLYELGLGACERRDRSATVTVLEELITTLDFGYGAIADGFHRIYAYCVEQVLGGEFARVAFVLEDLHTTLAEARTTAARATVANG